METLATLVQGFMDDNDVRSIRELTKMSAKTGKPLSHTFLSDTLKGKYPATFRDAKLRALADLLRLPVERVYKAAKQPAPGRPLAADLPPGADHLDAESRKAVVTMIRALLRTQPVSLADRRQTPAADSVPDSAAARKGRPGRGSRNGDGGHSDG